MTSRLTFTEGNHSYWLLDPDTGKKRRLPSVTTILGQMAKPALVKWAAREAAEYAVDYWDDLAAMPPAERRKLIAGAADRKKTSAAAKGTQLHAWAEDLINGRPVEVPPEHLPAVEGLARWWERSGWKVRATEAKVWSEASEYGECAYAGMTDLIAVDRDGRTILVDHKTGAGIWPEMGVQVAAYAAAQHLVTDDGDGPMPVVHRLCLLHVRPDGTTLHELPADQRAAAEERWSLLRTLRGTELPELTEKETA